MTAARRLCGSMVLAALFLLIAAPAVAQDDAITIGTNLQYEDESGERVPAAGVGFVVTDANGEPVGEGVTDEEGILAIPVDSPGEYTLEIDPTTLPDGVTLADPETTSRPVTVREGRGGRAIFGLVAGEATGGGSGLLRQILQLTTEGIKLGLFLGMAAIGLSLVYGTTGLTNFAHGEMVTWGGLTAYFFNFYGFAGVFGFMAGWPPPFGEGVHLVFATILAFVAGALLGWIFHRFIFSPLRERGVSLIAAMVVSIGISIFLRYIFLFAFGGNNRFYRNYTAQSAIDIGPIQITPKDIVTVGLSIIVLATIGLLLQQTKLGKAMRAVSDNRDLAESSGIDVEKVVSRVWIIGGGLAALGGVFLGLAEQVSWLSGFRFLLLIFAGVILGGLGTAYGALVGCLLVGIGIQVSTIVVPPELKNVGALAVLIVVLVFRPSGIMGRKERIG
jgi:neutral amino acid transport system permease protein